ncbi:MAG: type 4a pilus biogenesis protein PilO [bacterium]|nr:type 4a pilus biogenesis protein PilO [bacterium]
MKKSFKWVLVILVVVLAVLAAAFWDNGEGEQLKTELEELRANKAELKDTSDVLEQLQGTKKKLIKMVSVISEIKEKQVKWGMFKALPTVIPTNAWLKELFVQRKTLDLYVVFPGKAPFEKLMANLEKSPLFVDIEYYSEEQKEQKGELAYRIICNYKKPPMQYHESDDSDKLKRPMRPKNQVSDSSNNTTGQNRTLLSKTHVSVNSQLLMGVGNLPQILASSRNDGMREEIENLKKELRGLKKKQSRKAQMREEVKAKQDVLVKLKEIMPVKVDLDQVAEEIRKIASRNSITLKKCRRKKTANRYDYCEIPFSIEFSAQYKTFTKFVETMEKKRRLFNIKRLHILFSQGKLPQSRLDVSLEISTYLYLEGEKGKRKKKSRRRRG